MSYSRSRSPARSGAPHGAQLTDVHTIVKNLKDDVADLQEQVDAKSHAFLLKHSEDLQEMFDGAEAMNETLASATAGLQERDGEKIPSAIPDLRNAHEVTDLGVMCRNINAAVSEAKMAYHGFALQAKDAVNDADKMDIVVKACQTEFIKLKLMTNNAKARLNAHRLGWSRLGYAFRQWAEMVHWATIECIKAEMEEVAAEAAKWRAEHGVALEKARADLEALLGGQRRTKMQLMLLKMKNSRLASAYSTWYDWLMALKWERMEAERSAHFAALQARFAHLSAEEIERKLRQFMLRWINQKMIGPFKSWKDLLEAKRQREAQAALDAELNAMRLKLAQMGDNAALAKLKIYFATKLGKMKGMCFKALCVAANQSKAMKLLESEAGQRLKAFLAGKLQSLGRKCWDAWLRHHDNIAMENMKNNDRAKKVALLLEKIIRGLVHRQFSAFIRNHAMAEEERAALDAINGRLAMLDEFNKAKLRIFLDAKRLGKMSTFFKFWMDAWRNSALYAVMAEIEQEDEMLKELEGRIADAEAAIGGDLAKMSGQRGELARLEAEIAQVEGHIRDLEYQLSGLKRKIGETEELVADEKKARSTLQSQIRDMQARLDDSNAERDELSSELSRIAGEIGYVHKDSQWD